MAEPAALPLPGTTPRTSAPRWPMILHERFLEALRPRVMGPRIAAALGDGRATCHVLDAKYEPGVYGVILYEQAGRLVRADLAGEADRSWEEGAGRPRLVSPGIRLSPFPGDPDLSSLRWIMDPSSLGPVLQRALPDGGGREGRASRCRIRLLRYRPGKRATVLATLEPGGHRLVAKAYHRHDKAASVAAEAIALAATSRSSQHLRVAPPVAHLPGRSVVVQQAVDGISLDLVLGSRGSADVRAKAGVIAAALALAELHDLQAVTSRHRSVDRELVRFGERAERISSVSPEFGDRAAALARRLERTRGALPQAPIGPVHGDCKPSAFLLNGGSAYLLDLDHYGISDQAGDVGAFLASLRQLAVRHELWGRPHPASSALSSLGERFLEVYLAAAGRQPLRPLIRWHEAVALERKALRAFSRAPRSLLPVALVEQANCCLDQLAGTR